MAKFYAEYVARMQEMGDTRPARQFWKKYNDIEPAAYGILLDDARASRKTAGTPVELAGRLGMDLMTFAGFLDGLNSSLLAPFDLEGLEDTEEITLDANLPLLYRNMLDSKAQNLYTLPQWEDLLSQEERDGIRREWRKERDSQQAVSPHRNVGRNDPCPCGSGKKYKKCCWAKDHAAPSED